MKREEVEAELKRRGVSLSVGACGCCSSPWVKVAFDGHVVFDKDGVSLNNFEVRKRESVA